VGEMTVKRGKDPLSFENYCKISEIFMKKPNMEGVISHAVLTAMWNLMSRVGNAVKICKSHMQWDEDALLVFFAHEKTDQSQENLEIHAISTQTLYNRQYVLFYLLECISLLLI